MVCCPNCGHKFKKKKKIRSGTLRKVTLKTVPEGIEWYYAKGHRRVFISRCGKVWSKDTGKYKKFRKKDGYFVLSVNKKIKSLHRMLALTFIKGYAPGFVVNHIDGNKLNNNLDNLEWTTEIKNFCHAYDMGVFKKDPTTLASKRYQKAVREGKWITQTPKNGRIECGSVVCEVP